MLLSVHPRVLAPLFAAALAWADPAAAQIRPEVKLEEVAARSIARIATIDMRVNPKPTEADYRAAAILLGLAESLQPQDEEILRRRIEAAWSAGERELVIDLTARLVSELCPTDTLAQLRLITANLAKLTTAEERIAAYTRFLGPDGRVLDAAIRSRLALDMALLLRERGDTQAFVERLTQACQLDPSNKEAAALAVTFAGDRLDPIGRLDLTVNLLKADPIDPNVHSSLAAQFAAGGAYDASRRFVEVQGLILQASGLPTTGVDGQLKALIWLQQGPAALMDAINQDRVNQMDMVAKRRARAIEEGIPVDQMERPEDVRVSVPDAIMQALAMDAVGDRPALESAVAEMAETVNRMGQLLLDPLKRPLNMNEEQAGAQLAAISLQLQLIRLWTGVQVDQAQAALAPGEALPRIVPEASEHLRSWLKLRIGDPQGAHDDLIRVVETDPGSRAGVGLALEMLGRKDEAVEQYGLLVRAAPLTTAGAWARARLDSLGATLDPDQVERLGRYADNIPEWIDRAAARPGDYVRLDVALEQSLVDAVERTDLRVSITNTSPIPLALGSDRPINTRLLLSPKLHIPGIFMPALIRPEVVDAARQLRLMPRETLTFTIWPDPGETGLLMELLAFRNTRVRWRIHQGFWIDQAGGYRPGPMCLTTETPLLIRRPLPDATFSGASYLAKIQGDPERLLPRVAVALRSVLLNRQLDPVQGEPPPNDDMVIPVAEALAARYPTLSPVGRAMMASVLPHQRMAPSMKAVDDVVRADEDPVVRCVALVTRVVTSDDELLAASLESTDERVRTLAGLVKDRLDKAVPFYATWDARFLRRPPDQPAPPEEGR